MSLVSFYTFYSIYFYSLEINIVRTFYQRMMLKIKKFFKQRHKKPINTMYLHLWEGIRPSPIFLLSEYGHPLLRRPYAQNKFVII